MSSNIKQFLTGIALEPLSADPSNPVEGQLQRSDGTVRSKGVWEYKDGSWQELGSGAGSLDIVGQETFKNTVVADFEDGNSSTFLDACAGALVGSLSDETSSPIKGDSSAKYTQAASGSTNDFFVLPAFTLSKKEQQNFLGISFYYTYDGADDDIKFVIYDATNNEVLSDSTELLKLTSGATRYSTSVYIPDGVTSLKVGFQILSDSNAAVLVVDEFELSTSPFRTANLEDTDAVIIRDFVGYGSTNTFVARFDEIAFPESDYVHNTIAAEQTSPNGLFKITSSSTLATQVEILRDGTYDVNANMVFTSGGYLGIVRNGTNPTTAVYNLGQQERLTQDYTQASAQQESTAWSGKLYAGDIIWVQTSGLTQGGNATSAYLNISGRAPSEYVVTPAKATSETITHNGYTSKSSNKILFANEVQNTGDKLLSVDTSGGYTEFSALKEIIVDISYGVQGTSTRYFVYVKDSGGSAVAQSSSWVGGSNQDQSGSLSLKLNEGDVFYMESAGTPNNNDSTYLSANARPIEATFLAAIPIDQVAYLSDQKALATNPGTSAADAVQTRTLNTLEGDTGFISLSSNEFTLSPGKYIIEASAPAFQVRQHQAFLYDVTNTAYIKDGTTCYETNVSAGIVTRSFIEHTLDVSTSTTYSIRHWTRDAETNFGLGGAPFAGNNPASTAIYTQVKITKIK